MMRHDVKFPCGECGKFVTAGEKHTLKDCREWNKELHAT